MIENIINKLKMIDFLNFSEYLDTLYLPKVGLMDILEILLMVFIIYQVQKHLSNTRVLVIIKGLIILCVIYFACSLIGLKVIEFIFQTVITLSILALIILFEPEIKKILEELGNHKQIQPVNFLKTIIYNIKHKNFSLFQKKVVNKKRYSDESIKEILEACSIMSEAKTGALIILEQDSLLNEYIQTGISINGDISSQLLLNIFEHNTPLHDGAIIIRKDKIAAATCYLPLSDNKKINKSLGTRHRAGIGLSEKTDAIVIIVSEETGSISFVKDGKLQHKITVDTLHNLLNKYQISEKQNIITKKSSLKHNTSQKIFSLVFGILLWVGIINSQDPLDSTSFTIPVELKNEQTLEDVGKTFELISGEFIDVKVTAPRSILRELNENDIKAIADFKKLSYTYSIPIEVSIPTLNDSDYKLYTNNATVELELDELIDLNTNIQIETIGKCLKGYYLTELTSNTNSITITGAESIINTIDKVIARANISNKNDNFTLESLLTVYDKNGNIITSDLYSISQSSVIINGVILPTKQIPITINITNEMTENYTLTNKIIDKENLLIFGTEEELNKIDSIIIDLDINNEKITESYIKTYNLKEYLPENIGIAEESNKINISMTFDIYKTRDIEISVDNINILNQNINFEYVFNKDTFILTFKGLEENLNFDISNLNLSLDVENLNKGNYNLPIYIENIPENITLISDGIISFSIKRGSN